MFCTNCGKHLSDDTRFCPHCGAPVNGVPDGAAKEPDSAAIKPKGDEPGKSAKKGVSIKAILLIGIVVCAAVFAVSRIFAGGSDAAGQLDGTYYLIGDGGSWLELDFHAKTVEMTVNGDTRECQYTGQFDPDTGELMLGSIVISKQKVVEQAEEYGHTVEREYAFLIAHSMLHLLGYDHMEEEERAVMEKKQREILDGLGITR